MTNKRINTCVDCPASILQTSTRCLSCCNRRGFNRRWKGGRSVNAYGYVELRGYPDHPNTQANGRIKEHILVMSKVLGRPLRKGESVHHKNGIKDDNRPENLELWSKGQPTGQRVEDKIAWAKEFLEEYGYTVERVVND